MTIFERFSDWLSDLPHRAIVDFARNIAFCITLQTITLALTSPTADDSYRWPGIILAVVMVPAVAALVSFSVKAFTDNWTDMSPRTYRITVIFAIVTCFAASQVIKWRIFQLV